MSESNTSKWPHVVAIVGIVVGAAGTGFGVWANSNAETNMAKIEARQNFMRLKYTHIWTSQAHYCSQLSTVSEKIAEERAQVFSNLKVAKRAAMEGYMWAGLSYLPKDSQAPFWKRYKEGKTPADKYGYHYVRDLSTIVLRSLAKEAAICRRNLVATPRMANKSLQRTSLPGRR